MKEIWYFAKVEKGKLVGFNRKQMEEELLRYEGKHVELIIRRKRKYRSLEQNRVQWWYYTEISQHTGYTKEDVHEICRQQFLKIQKVNEATGTVFDYVKSTTELSTTEHMAYTESIRRWAAIEFQMNLPEPNEQVKIFN